jgi:hypothetical protein
MQGNTARPSHSETTAKCLIANEHDFGDFSEWDLI